MLVTDIHLNLTWLTEHLMENMLILKLTSKQKSNLVTWGAFIAIMPFVTSRFSPTPPPNSPGFDPIDAWHLLFSSVGIVMILAGLLCRRVQDVDDK